LIKTYRLQDSKNVVPLGDFISQAGIYFYKIMCYGETKNVGKLVKMK